MPMIALTGNFGMGKTTVLRLFNEAGARTFSADDFVHEILRKPENLKRVSRVLGEHVLTRHSGRTSLNKKLVADIIFHDPVKRRAVERIIHPLVLKKIKSTVSALLKKDPPPTIIFEVPLLFEAGFEKYFDKTIVVASKRAIAIKRLRGREFTKDQIRERLRAQLPITTKKKLADFVINNNEDISTVQKKVKKVFRKLQISPSL